MSTSIMKLTASDLAALLCARICHDLVSPIGALGAALEVFDDDDNLDMRDDAIDLIRLSARQASAKLQFLRLAFGAGGSCVPSVCAPRSLGLPKPGRKRRQPPNAGKCDCPGHGLRMGLGSTRHAVHIRLRSELA